MTASAVLIGRSAALLRQDEAAAALECAEEALDEIRASFVPEKASEISALCACADAFAALGQAEKSLSSATEACTLSKNLGDELVQASSLLTLAKVHLLADKDAVVALAVLRERGVTLGEMALILSLAQNGKANRSQVEEARRKENRWHEAFLLLSVSLASLPKAGPAAVAVAEFLRAAKQLGLVDGGSYEPGSSIRRLYECGGSAQELYELARCRDAAKKSGDRQRAGWALLDIASAKLSQKPSCQVAEADEALTIFSSLGLKSCVAAAQLEVSRSRLGLRPVEALQAAQASALAFKELHSVSGESAAQSASALAHLALGQVPEAIASASAAEENARKGGLRRNTAEALLTASSCHLAAGEQGRALQDALEAAAILREVGDSRGEAFALLFEVASAYMAKMEGDLALKVASAGLRLLRSAEDLLGEALALKATANIHIERGDTEPALRLLQEVITICHDTGNVLDEVEGHAAVARIRLSRNEAEEAESSAQAGLALAKEAGNKLAEARALLCLSKALALKDLPKAAETADAAAVLFKTLGDRQGHLQALRASCVAGCQQGAAGAAAAAVKAEQVIKEMTASDLQAAGEAHLEASHALVLAARADQASKSASAALTIFRQLGHTKAEAMALRSLAHADRARGRPEEAAKAIVEIVSLFKRRGDVQGQANATGELAKAYLEGGLPKEALSEVGEARLLFQRLGKATSKEGMLLIDVGIPAHMALDDPPKAVALAEEAVNIFRSLANRLGEAQAFQASVKVCVQKGDLNSALQVARQSCAVLARARLTREEAEAHHVTAKVHLVRLEPREAVASAAQALTLLRRPGDEKSRVDVLETASWAHSMAAEPEGAVGAADEAVAICRRIGDRRRLVTSLQTLAEAQLVKATFRKAMDTVTEALALCRQADFEPRFEAHLLQASSLAKLGIAERDPQAPSRQKHVKEALQEAKAAAGVLCRCGDRRAEAEAYWCLAKANLEAGNVDSAAEDSVKAFKSYATLRDGSGAGWAALLLASTCLRSKGRQQSAEVSHLVQEEITIPDVKQALDAVLNAHSTFRRINDEEGQEAALQLLAEIRATRDGAMQGLPQDMPRPRPLPAAFSTPPPSQAVSEYRVLVGARYPPCRTGFILAKPALLDLEDIEPSSENKPALLQKAAKPDAEPALKETAPRSALASLDNWDKRFDRKVWHNVKATTSGLWEYPDMGQPEQNVHSAEFVNSWLEELLAPEHLKDE